MRLSILLISFLIIFTSCTVTEKPEFIKVNSVQIVETTVKDFTIEAKILFFNKNSIGGTLQANDVHIFIDSLDVAILQSEPFKVPKKDQFEVPFRATLSFKKVFDDHKQNLLGNIMNMILRKKVLVQYKGEITYKSGVFSYDYPLDYQQNMSIQKK